jgi:acyl carrier protein
MTIEQRLRQFIIENFYVTDPAEVQDDTLLVTAGFIDSTGMLEVIAFLEEEFGIQVADHETTPENLESVARMAAFVTRKRAGSSPPGGVEAVG